MHASPGTPRRPPNLIVLLVAAGFILGIGAGYLSTLFSTLQSKSSAVSLQSPTITATSTAIPPTPTLFLPTLPPGLPEEPDSTTPQTTLAPTLENGKPVPDFTLKTLDGQAVNLADYAGKPILINIWATWCPPCRDEMTTIQAAYEKYQSKGLVVLGINYTAQDSRPDVIAFVNSLKLTYPILMDETGDVSSGKFGVHALPMTFFIDPMGAIQRTTFGAMLPADLDTYITGILPK